jgi:hypothetical protein
MPAQESRDMRQTKIVMSERSGISALRKQKERGVPDSGVARSATPIDTPPRQG